MSEPLRCSLPSSSVLLLPLFAREGQGPLEILQLDFEMENFTSQSVKRRIMWHIDYRGHGALPDLERAVTELTVIQRDVQAILPLAMVSRRVSRPADVCVHVPTGRCTCALQEGGCNLLQCPCGGEQQWEKSLWRGCAVECWRPG